MRTNRTRSVMSKRTTTTTAGIIALAIGALAGCSGNPGAGNAAYKEGELGNGDFLFACDDGAACLPYSGDASKFPEQIATGSNFDVRFVAKEQQGSAIIIKEKRFEGIVAQPVEPFVSKGPEGFTAKKPGFGTIIVRDSKGTVIDYVTIKIVQPNDLIVYEADYDVGRGKEPPRIQTMTMKVGAAQSYRVVAEYGAEPAAGSIPVKWEFPESTDVAVVESYTRGVVNLRAKTAGKATLKAVAGGLEKTIEVEVTQ